jgi:MFS family permease
MLDIQKKLSVPFLILLSLPTSAMGLGLSIQTATLTWILVTKYNLDLAQVGIVWSVGPMATIIGTILVGALSDRTWFMGGRRRPYIAFGGLLTALALFALPNIGLIASSLDWFTVIGVAITVSLFIDLSINVSFNPSRALIADITPEGPIRAKSFLWMQTISGSISVIGYGIGAYFGNYALIYCGAVAILCFMLIPIFFIQESREIKQTSPTKGLISITEIVRIVKPLWGLALYTTYAMVVNITSFQGNSLLEIGLIIVSLLFLLETVYRKERPSLAPNIFSYQKTLAANSLNWFGAFTIMMFLVPYIRYRLPGISDEELGQINNWSLFIYNGVAIFAPVFVLDRFVKRLGMIHVHMYSQWALVLAFLLLSFFGTSAWQIWTFLFIGGFAWSSMITLPFAIYSQSADKDRMGLFTGVFNLSMILPMLIVSLRFGQLMEESENKSILFKICALLIVGSIVFWNQVKKREERLKPL